MNIIMKGINGGLSWLGYVPFPALVEAERDVRRLNRENSDLARRLNSLDEAHTHRLSALEEAKTRIRELQNYETFLTAYVVAFTATGSKKPTRLELIVSTVKGGKRKDTIVVSRVYSNKNYNELEDLRLSLQHRTRAVKAPAPALA